MNDDVDTCAHCGAARVLQRAALDLARLSAREREVVEALRLGFRLTEIARRLGIRDHTARNHMKSIRHKLEVHSQVELLSMLSGSEAERQRCIELASHAAALAPPGPVQDALTGLATLIHSGATASMISKPRKRRKAA